MSDLIVASLMILKKQCHPPPKKVFLRSDELMMRTNVQCRMIRKTRSIAVARRRMTSRLRDTSALHHSHVLLGTTPSSQTEWLR